MPTTYFVIRTDDDVKEWMWRKIQKGRLRQGWGLSNMALPLGERSGVRFCSRNSTHRLGPAEIKLQSSRHRPGLLGRATSTLHMQHEIVVCRG